MTNDVEGLGYDPKKSELIFACKGSPNLKGHKKYKHSKAYYTYNIETKKFNEEPKFVLDDDQLIDFVSEKMKGNEISKSKLKKLKKRIKEFSPSAIAKHPKENHFCIISSVGKSLVVCDDDGFVLDIVFLNPDIHSQPEGITFDSDGRIYISNEGLSLVAKIYQFDNIKL